MKRFCLVMIVVAALVVAGSSNNAFAAVAANSNVISNNQVAISPYWQADANSVYTFIAVSVPSLQFSVSRQVTVTAVTSDSRSAASATATVWKGSTKRFFIANTNHSSVNNNTVTGVNWISVTGRGHVVITTVPANSDRHDTALPHCAIAGVDHLSLWGAVVVPGGTGFAMEFIGDMTDSQGYSLSYPAAFEQGL